MNTRIAPFDSEDARRALSYALDRSELIRRTGGLQFGQPTCQILPPNFPGYKPYCPYTLLPGRPARGGAPDLTKARKLIARSHTRGMQVTVLGRQDYFGTRIAGYLVQLLDRLGYGPRKNSFRTKSSRGRLRSQAHAPPCRFTPAQWFADYPSPAAFIQPAFSCGGPTNDSGFCNRRLDVRWARRKRLNRPIPAPQMPLGAHRPGARRRRSLDSLFEQ